MGETPQVRGCTRPTLINSAGVVLALWDTEVGSTARVSEMSAGKAGNH